MDLSNLPKHISVPKEGLLQLLHLNVVMTALFDALSKKENNLLLTKLKDIILPDSWGAIQDALENADKLCIGHLLHDFVKVTDVLIECVEEQKYPTSTDTLQ